MNVNARSINVIAVLVVVTALINSEVFGRSIMRQPNKSCFVSPASVSQHNDCRSRSLRNERILSSTKYHTITLSSSLSLGIEQKSLVSHCHDSATTTIMPRPSLSSNTIIPIHPLSAANITAPSVTTLRKKFGPNKNKLWGDLDPSNARRLYHALLPRDLLRLSLNQSEQNPTAKTTTTIPPQSLARMAFDARRAAKDYVRYRSIIPCRLLAMTIDGWRHWRHYGRWSSKGLSWDEIWCKYKDEVMREWEEKMDGEGWNEGTMALEVSRRILERSCVTNERVDQWALGS